MTMIIRQEQTIKATEVSTMHCKADSGDIWKREVVLGIGRAEVAEPADGILSFGVYDDGAGE